MINLYMYITKFIYLSCFPYSIDSQLLGSAFGQSRIFDFIYKFGQGASIRDVSNNKIKITVKFTEKNIQKE